MRTGRWGEAFPGGHRAQLLTGILAVLQESVKDESEQKEGLCLIQEVHRGSGISPLLQWDVAVLTPDGNRNQVRESSNIWLVFLACLGKIDQKMKKTVSIINGSSLWFN